MRHYEEILVKLKTTIEEITLGTQAASAIADDATLMADLGLDSLDYASVLLACEQWLDIKVNEEDVNWASIASVADLAKFMQSQQK